MVGAGRNMDGDKLGAPTSSCGSYNARCHAAAGKRVLMETDQPIQHNRPAMACLETLVLICLVACVTY